MSAASRRFSGFSSRSRRAKAAGAVIACTVLLLAGCGGSAGSSAESGAPVVRGDAPVAADETAVVADAASGSLTAKAGVGVGEVVVSWSESQTSSTQKVTGYEVQVSTDSGGTWAGAGTGCAKDTTTKSTALTCTATGLAAGTYSFRIATLKKNPNTKATKRTDFSPGTAGVIVIAAPGTPAKPTVVAGDAKVNVTVAAGTATDGTLGGTPASYTVTASPAVSGGTCTVTGASGSCPVTGLTNGTAYTFTATATNTAGTSPVSAASVPVTLVAVSGPQFKVEYVDVHQEVSPKLPARQWVARGSSVTIAANVATPCPDYCWGFAGWSPLTDDSGPVYSPGDVITPTANMKLYAQWFPMITYDPNGGLGTMPTKAIREGGRMEAPTFTNGNLLFVGWNTKADGSGKLYNTGTADKQPGSIFADTTVTKMTMYAQWRTQPRISFDANDGRGIVKETTINYPTVKFFITSGNLPTVTREGYRFTTWCVDPFPVSNDWCRNFYDDDSVLFYLQEDVRLFARWKKN